MNALAFVGAGLLAKQATRSGRRTASSFFASKPAPTGFNVEGLHHG